MESRFRLEARERARALLTEDPLVRELSEQDETRFDDQFMIQAQNFLTKSTSLDSIAKLSTHDDWVALQDRIFWQREDVLAQDLPVRKSCIQGIVSEHVGQIALRGLVNCVPQLALIEGPNDTYLNFPEGISWKFNGKYNIQFFRHLRPNGERNFGEHTVGEADAVLASGPDADRILLVDFSTSLKKTQEYKSLHESKRQGDDRDMCVIPSLGVGATHVGKLHIAFVHKNDYREELAYQLMRDERGSPIRGCGIMTVPQLETIEAIPTSAIQWVTAKNEHWTATIMDIMGKAKQLSA